ncbi:MAG: cadmium-translocating P-type ATPase [Erysipelotrichaceae bacterium]|nr:cadmium-translocating P-type ATPase [Erysipelotrichaceae bacterium]
MSRKLKKRLIRIIITGTLFIPVFIVDKVIDLSSVFNSDLGWLFPLFIYLTIYLIISYDILIKAAKNIAHGRVFDENFLMIVATIGAFAIKEFPEAVAVMLFYQVGEFFQDLAVGKSRKEISSLMDIKAEVANVIKSDGSTEEVEVELVELDTLIKVLPGDKIPLDGIIVKGSSSLDTKALTGESIPREITVGEEVVSGAINLDSPLEIKVTKTYENSTVNKILELVENSTNAKSSQEKFITKFAKWYTPVVVISAILVALIGSLVTKDYMTWISRSLNFLVVSCPCAIVISVPLSFFISIGRAAKLGILIKGSTYLENFNKARTFAFDKTGTLTKGNFVVTNIYPSDKKDEILEAAYIVERDSNHPIALSIKNAYKGEIKEEYEIKNIPGKGMSAQNKNNRILVGNMALLKENSINLEEIDEVGTIVYVAKNGNYLGAIVIKDEVKEESKELISYLSKEKISTIMLTGDNERVASEVASSLALTSYRHSLLPQDKVGEIDKIIKSNKNGELLVYIGDGINDAPSLARSDIGIAMGALGSDAAIEASNIVLMNDNLTSVIKAKKIAKKTMNIVTQNIVFALAVKLTILILSVFGIASIWLAVFGDVGVALLCILNALRSGKIK